MSDIYFNSQINGTNVRVLGFRQQIFSGLLKTLWRWMPGLTRKVLMRFFMATGSYALNADEQACLQDGQPFQVRVHDKTIQAWKWGQGPGVLMVHGWGGRGAQFHRFVQPLVRAGYTAIAIDGPGHGQSDGRTTNYFEFTDTVRAFLSPEQGLDIQGLIGHSFGAAAIINGLEKEQRNLPAVCIAPILRLQELLVHTFERFGVPAQVHTAAIGAFEKQYGYNLNQDNPPQLTGKLNAPLLMIHDTQDRSAAYSESEHQAEAHDHIQLFSTHGLGHRRILSDAGVISQALEHIGPFANLEKTA